MVLDTPRVRFAPAPSGYLHVGSARSALFNWLFAKHLNGTFILRIEDTNVDLAKPEFYEAITRPLEWLGLLWDEGPYYQSQRTEKYIEAVNSLLDSGHAYCCVCSREDIDSRNKETGFRGGYDGHCRNRQIKDGPGVTVRFRTPDSGTIVVTDLIRGKVEFHNSELEDFVIRRSNGSPVFLVANAVDDADMRISHVIRGEDLLNTTPKVILLWEALGYGMPPQY
ncbi:MAG: glutamyl-tRNA synthetase, partial [marine actinobacterium MedAcidi-G2A]